MLRFDHGAAAGMWNSQEAWPMWNVEFTGAAGGMWNPKLLDNAVPWPRQALQASCQTSKTENIYFFTCFSDLCGIF